MELLKEWDENQTECVRELVAAYLSIRPYNIKDKKDVSFFLKDYNAIDNILGFAYTSSGRCAGLWICNTLLYMDSENKLIVRGFVLDACAHVYALCEDKNENTFYIMI